MADKPWTSNYPGTIASTSTMPDLVDNVDTVLSSHPEALRDDLIGVQNVLGPNPPANPSGIPFTPTTAETGTIIISGPAPTAYSLSDVAATTYNTIDDVMVFSITDPGLNTVVTIPVTLPVAQVWDKVQVRGGFAPTLPLPVDVTTGVTFTNGGSRAFGIQSSIGTAPAAKGITFFENDAGVVGAFWNGTTETWTNNFSYEWDLELIQPVTVPFAARTKVTAISGEGGGNIPPMTLYPNVFLPTGGTFTPAWAGDNITGSNIFLVFQAAHVGTIDIIIYLSYHKHPIQHL